MTCNEYVDRINGFVDGEPGSGSTGDLFGHLAGCESCRSYLAFMMSVRRITRQDIPHFPSDIDDAMLAHIRSASGETTEPTVRRRIPFWRRPLSVSLPVAVTAVLAILVGSLILWRAFYTPRAQTQLTPASIGYQGTPTAVIVIYGIPPVEVTGKLTTHTIGKPLPIQQ